MLSTIQMREIGKHPLVKLLLKPADVQAKGRRGTDVINLPVLLVAPVSSDLMVHLGAQSPLVLLARISPLVFLVLEGLNRLMLLSLQVAWLLLPTLPLRLVLKIPTHL